MRPEELQPEDRAFYVACCEAAPTRRDPAAVSDPHVTWFGHVDHFNVADQLGKSRRWAETRAEKFERWGWWESRNNFDAWILRAGVEVYTTITGKVWMMGQGAKA